jgi:hypothetical protein
MTIALSVHPETAPLSDSEGLAWLEWNADTDWLHFSSDALSLLGLKPTEAPKTESDFSYLFDKSSRNKLAIAFEDLLTQGQTASVELLRQTSAPFRCHEQL